ncbi:liver specific protein 2, putative [Plasmodium yoelii]|uniref:Liver specific protein 2, putative n=1 Tax=Plasmodium yoelii TaxID=5861 RepID=A0A077YFM0_PLAYE|nr:liver specific protein 2, putative [Plasmodium yoelii]
MKDHIKNVCFRKTLLISLLLIILKYTKYDYLEKENGGKQKYNSNISSPSLLRTYFGVYVNRKNKDVKALKKLLKNVTISNNYLCMVKKVDINVYNKICGNKINKIILNNERKYEKNDLKKKCITTESSSCTFDEEKKRKKLFTDYEKINLYKNSNPLEDIDTNGNTIKGFLFELFDIIEKIKKIVIDASNKIISMCLFNNDNYKENLFDIKNNKDYNKLHNYNSYKYYENPNINTYNINKELYVYNEEYAHKYLYSFIDISPDNLNVDFYKKEVQGGDRNIVPEIFKNKNVYNLSKDKKYDIHDKMNDGNKSNCGVSSDKAEKYIFDTETNRSVKLKKEQFLEKSENWNESKINQSNKLHKKNNEVIYRSIGRILAEPIYENLVLNTDRNKEKEREREIERKQEREWEKEREKDRNPNTNKNKPNPLEEKLLLIIKEQKGDPKSENSEQNQGITVLEFSRTPSKKKKRSCTILAENESETSGEDKEKDKKQDKESNTSDNNNGDSPASPAPNDSNYDSPASPAPNDVPEGNIQRPSRLIAEKESENKSEDKKQDNESNTSDNNNGDSPVSPSPNDVPEGNIKRPSRLIAEKESENNSKNKSEDKKQNKESNTSDNKNEDSNYDNPASPAPNDSNYDSPASPAPNDVPEGNIQRPSRLIAEKESENNSENKSEDKKQDKETNTSDNNNGDNSSSPVPNDVPEGNIQRPSRLIAEKESENNSKNKSEDKKQNKESNTSDNKNEDSNYDNPASPAPNDSNYDSPASPAPNDVPEGNIQRPSRLIAEKESENNSENKSEDKKQDKETNTSDNNNGDNPASPAPNDSNYDSPASPSPNDVPEGNIKRPSRLIAEKESENNSENKSEDKEQNKSSPKSNYDSPASPAPNDVPEGNIKRPSRLIAEKESENNSKNKSEDKKQNKETNTSDNNNGDSNYDNPSSPAPNDVPEGNIKRPSRLIAEKESENKSESNSENKSEDKKQDKESNTSDNNNGERPATPFPNDLPEDKPKRPTRLFAEKESENNGENKNEDKKQDKETNTSDNNNGDRPASPAPNDSNYDSPASPAPNDVPEGNIKRPSRLIAENESENKENEKKKKIKVYNTSGNNNGDSPASPAPNDVPEGNIKRPSRLIAEKESENNSENKSEDKKQDKETNTSDNNNGDNPASPAPNDVPEDKPKRPTRLFAEKESENNNENKNEDKKQNKESNTSDNKNEDSNYDNPASPAPNDSNYDNPASPAPNDVPEGNIKRPSRLIAEKESENNSENKNEYKEQNKEYNTSDNNSGDIPESPVPNYVPEGKFKKISRLIAKKESENNRENKSEDKKQDKETNTSDNKNDDRPATPVPNDVPEGNIKRPSRLIAEKETENNGENKSEDKKQDKETNTSDNNHDDRPATPAPNDVPEANIKRPSRLIAEKESENNSENKSENKETNTSDNKNGDSNYDNPASPAPNDDSNYDNPASPAPNDVPEGNIKRPSRLIAEKESENNSENNSENKESNTSDNNNGDDSASSVSVDIPEGNIKRPSRLIAEKESENNSENKNDDKKQDKETNTSDNNNEVSNYDNPASPAPNDSNYDNPASPVSVDIPEGNIKRPSRLIAEKESENNNKNKNEDKKHDKETNTSDNKNEDSNYDNPALKIRMKNIFPEKIKQIKVRLENGQKWNLDEERKSMFEKIKKKKQKYKKKYYAYDMIEKMEYLSSLSDDEYFTNDGAPNHAQTSSVLGKYLKHPNTYNKYLDINLFFDEKPYQYRKGNYYFINPFPYSIIKMKKNEGLSNSEKIKYDGVYCYSLSFNNYSSLTYTIENSFRNVKPIEEIIPGTLTGFKSDDGYQKMLTPMFVEQDMFLHCAFKNEYDEIENKIASFPVKIFLKKNLNKTKGCSFQINKNGSIYKEYAERESFLSKKVILNDESTSNECDITATNEIIGFQCGPPYKYYTNDSNTSYIDKIFFNTVNNEDIKIGEYFKVEPAHCFEEVNANEHIEDIAPGSFPFPNFEMINGGLKSHHTRYIKLKIRDPNAIISCYCNYYNNGKIIYSGIMTINGKKKYNDQSYSDYPPQDINKTSDNAKGTGHKTINSNKKSKIDNTENYDNDYKYFFNFLPYYNPYLMQYKKQPEYVVKNDFIYDSKYSDTNNDEFLKKIKNNLSDLKLTDNNEYIHDMDDNLRYKYDNRDSNVYPISEYDLENHFDSDVLSDSYGHTFNDDYISPHSNSYYEENTYNSDDIFSNYDDVNIEAEYEEFEPLQNNVTFQDNKSYEDKSQSIIVINKSKNVNLYIPKNKIKNKSEYTKNNEDIEDNKKKDALLKYLLLTYEETPDKNEKMNKKLKLFKEYFPSSPNHNIFVEEKENDNTSNKIKSIFDNQEKSIESLSGEQINGEIEVSENDSTLDHNKSYNYDNTNSNNHENNNAGVNNADVNNDGVNNDGVNNAGVNNAGENNAGVNNAGENNAGVNNADDNNADDNIDDDTTNFIMDKILHDLFGHNEYDGNKEENPKNKKIYQTKINTIENEEDDEEEEEEEEDLIEKDGELEKEGIVPRRKQKRVTKI